MNLNPHRKLLSLAAILCSLPALAVVPGTAAPDFKGTDSTGTQHTLSQYRGKFVVLEWANQGCPYDRKHYLSGSMESQQRDWTAKGVVWLSILSSGVGQQGYVNPAEENEYLKKMHAAPTAAILDPTSTHARLPTKCSSWRKVRHSTTSSQYTAYSPTIESPEPQ